MFALRLSTVVFIASSGAAATAAGFDLKMLEARCLQEKTGEPFLYRKHFNEWNFTPERMIARFAEIHADPRRLLQRAWVENGKILIRADNENRLETIEIPAGFVKNLARHFEDALKKKYVEHIFFPDMGHNHFYLPAGEYEKTKEALHRLSEAQRLQTHLNNVQLRMMYHTAEQLISAKELPTNPLGDRTHAHWAWRTLNRYLVGTNDDDRPIEIFKGDREFAETGFTSVGGGVYFSSNENGCFPYTANGQTLYFDISFKPYGVDPADPPVEPTDE